MAPPCGPTRSSAAPPCGQPQPQPQPQFLHLASGGPRSTTGTSSVHPLVPLLLCSDRHLPSPSPPYEQRIGIGIGVAAAKRAEALPGFHGDGVTRQVVKKPLNAFMLYMKETRQQLLQDGRQRESAAVNRLLGRRWNALSPAEQSKYYELAHRERRLHMQLHPGWSARDNYGKRKKKPKQPPQVFGSSH